MKHQAQARPPQSDDTDFFDGLNPPEGASPGASMYGAGLDAEIRSSRRPDGAVAAEATSPEQPDPDLEDLFAMALPDGRSMESVVEAATRWPAAPALPPPSAALPPRASQALQEEGASIVADLLRERPEVYSRLEEFLSASDIERHRLFMKGRSIERQNEFYQLIATYKLRPDDEFIVAIGLLGIIADYANAIPQGIDHSMAQAALTFRQAVDAALAPYGGVPGQIRLAVDSVDQATARLAQAAEGFSQEGASEMRLLIQEFESVGADVKNQMICGLEKLMSTMIENHRQACREATQESRAIIEAIRHDAVAAAKESMAGEQAAIQQAMKNSSEDAQGKLAIAMSEMVSTTTRLAQDAASSTFRRASVIFGSGVAVGILALLAARLV